MRGHLPIPVSLCFRDDLSRERNTGKFHVNGWFDSLRAKGFPHELSPFAVCIALTGAKGDFPSRVVCIGAEDVLAFASPLHTVRLVQSQVTVWAVYRIRRAVFPVAGIYRVQFMCENHLLVQRSLRVRFIGGNGDV